MKRLTYLFLLIILSANVFAQSVNSRAGNSYGAARKPDYSVAQRNYNYTLTNDTCFLTPRAMVTYVKINPLYGDTLQTAFWVSVSDVTTKGVTYSDNYAYLGDKIILCFQTQGTGNANDTIKFDGNIQCDSTGLGNTSTLMVIPNDVIRKRYMIPFTFDGAKFVQDTYMVKPQ